MESIGIAAIVKATVLILIGWMASRYSGRLVQKLAADRMDASLREILRLGLVYIVFGIFFVMGVRALGFELTVLLSAAGILTVAVGFASQTSASNIISGLFILGERSFSIGDVIRVGDITGEVLSIDLLSVKVRTFDNLFVRLPNENLMKTTVVTLTRFPIRRYDLLIGIAFKEDIGKARELLLKVADDFHLCLDEPKPMIIMRGFGESSIDIQFSVWATRERFLDMRNGLMERVKQAFDEAGVEIPFPHRTLYAGSMTEPLPVKLIPPDSPV